MKKLLICASFLLFLCGCEFATQDITGKDNSNDVAMIDDQVITDNTNDNNDNNTDVNGNDKENTADKELFEQFEDQKFLFMSGVGGWETHLQIDEDGSFFGMYYDLDMGDTGIGYDEGGTFYNCRFHGKLSNPVKIDDYSYEVSVSELEYEKESGTSEIIKGTRYVYSDAYGLTGTDKLVIYLPGMPTKDLPKEYIDWVGYMTFSNENFVVEVPEKLPYAGIYNPANSEGFYSEELTEEEKKTISGNTLFMYNKNSFPGMVNKEYIVNDDNTYFVTDCDVYGTHPFYNGCLPDKNPDDTRENKIKAAIDYIGLSSNLSDLTIIGEEEQPLEYEMTHVDGKPAYYVLWQSGSNEDTRQNCAKVLWENGYIYIFAVSVSEYDILFNSELKNMYLNSLVINSNQAFLSSGTDRDAQYWSYAYVKGDMANLMLLVDEVVWVSSDDEELMKTYGLTIDDMPNDYAIVEKDKFEEFDFAMDCPCYLLLPYNGISGLVTVEQFADYAKDSSDGKLMVIVKDHNNRITLMYEPYTP